MNFLLFFCFHLIALTFSKLEMVIEFIRHGARGPNDINWNPSIWGDISDIHQLTEVGMRQSYILGREMRRKYIEKEEFLSKSYNRRELYVRSTESSRALQSASSHLYGLYPLGTGLKINDHYPLEILLPPYINLTINIQDMGNDALPKRFQPVDIHSIDSNKDMLLNYPNNCPGYKILKENQMKSALYKSFNKQFNETFKKLRNIFNQSDSKPWDISRVSKLTTNIYADIFRNNPIPEGLTQEIWNNMTFIKGLERQFVDVGSEIQRKFMGTPLFKEIKKYLIEKIDNPKLELKYVLFSGHYLTLTPIMAGLNITSWECLIDKFNGISNSKLNCEEGYPIYASQILIELHSILNEDNNKEYFVKVIYNGKEMNLCEQNKKECEFSDLMNRLEKNIIIDNFEKICNDMNFAKSIINKKEKPFERKESLEDKFTKFLSNAVNGMRASDF